MKTLKQFLNESYQSHSNRSSRYDNKRSYEEELALAVLSPIYKDFMYKNRWKIEVTVHAGAQAYERRPEFELNDWKKLHTRTLTKIQELLDLGKFSSGYYVFYSRSMSQGYVVHIDTRKMLMKIITVLPRGRSRPKTETKLMIVEGVQITILDTIEVR